jgi:aspartate racemase
MDTGHDHKAPAESACGPRKALGVIGGMGPAATAHFYHLLTSMADAGADQEHPEVIIISRPWIPDRTSYITGKSSKSPVGPIIETGRELTAMGASYIAIPCVTSHFFFSELEAAVEAPIVNMVRETAARLARDKVRSAGLMATDGAIFGGMFQKELGALGIRAVLPPPKMQAGVMDLIYNNIKAGKPLDTELFLAVASGLMESGAETIVLACTELSLAKHRLSRLCSHVDALEVLARRCLELCGVNVS